MTQETVFEAQLNSLSLQYRGKVRDIFSIDEQHMMIVTTDRLSAFDVVLPDPIPRKGIVLTAISNFWFDKSKNLVKNHLSDLQLTDVIQDEADRFLLEDRTIIVKKLKALPVEAIVRGYIIGSGWKDYQQNGTICGLKLPVGLQQAQKLPETIYTPSTKAEIGDHDENISFEKTVELIGEDLANQIKEVSIKLYEIAAEFALQKGIIIADTKFEFGLDENDDLVLMDEILTPDSSRFWPVSSYEVGISPPSYDKQYVRDYLETLDWNKTAPGPALPQDVIHNTALKYQEAYNRLVLNVT